MIENTNVHEALVKALVKVAVSFDFTGSNDSMCSQCIFPVT